MKSLLCIWIFFLATLRLSAQDEVYMLAGYHYEGKITSVTENKVIIRRTNNKVSSIEKSDIWKLVYENGKEVILNESNESIEERIGKINNQETLEEIIRNGKDKEVEVAYYYLIRRGFQYELREKNLSEFIARFPDSKYRRELSAMAHFNRKLKESEGIGFKCTDSYTPDVVDRKGNLRLQFTDQLGASHTLEAEVLLKFIRTYGKKTKIKSASEWKNEYGISMVLDDSPEMVEFKDQYKLMEDQGDTPHKIFLSNVVFGEFNVNGQIEIGTNIRKDDGEYLINIDIQVDYLKW
jgi:hypothetical protein